MPASKLHLYLPQGRGALRHQLTVAPSLLFDWLSRLKVEAICHRRTSTLAPWHISSLQCQEVLCRVTASQSPQATGGKQAPVPDNSLCDRYHTAGPYLIRAGAGAGACRTDNIETPPLFFFPFLISLYLSIFPGPEGLMMRKYNVAK